MVLLQLGFLEAVRFTAINVYDQLDFDVALLAPNYEQFFDTSTFPLQRLQQAEAMPEVVSACPLYVTMGIWRCPPELANPDSWSRLWRSPRPLQMRELMVLGIDLQCNPFRGSIRESVEQHRQYLAESHRLLMNERSNPDFGWQRYPEYDDWELNQQKVEVVGGFELLRSFGADASVLCSDRTFVQICHWNRQQPCIGLLRITNASPEYVAAMLNEKLPDDVRAVTRAELKQQEEKHWVRHTATGEIFGFGVFVSMIVAGVVIFQVLSSDIRNHLAEYATLKAMGYANNFLGKVVVRQSIIYCMCAYILAVPISVVSYRVTEQIAQIPMHLTATNIVYVLLLTVAMGWISARICMAKVYSANPADLF